MKLVTPRLCTLFTLLWALADTHTASAVSRCVADKAAAYEQILCELKQTKVGSSLPSLAEFRRNPPAMQYLLLKRLAQRQGIPIKSPESASSNAAAAKKSVKDNSKLVLTTTLTINSTLVEPKESPEPGVQARSCRYSLDRVVCAGRPFKRQGNRANNRLAAGVLEAGNTLELGAPPMQRNEQQWLAEAYERYLRAMLSIGLAGSSFTYSGFAHTYYEHQAQGTDFSARFAQMFEYLKRDKKELAVSVRRPKRAPTEEECEWLSDDLLVCNSQAMNLVYLRGD